MKKMIVSLTILAAFGLPVVSFSEPEQLATAVEEAVVDVENTICPVSGEKVGEMGEPFLVEYQGKRYRLCCAGCAKDFQKDPETFIKKVGEELEAAQKSAE